MKIEVEVIAKFIVWLLKIYKVPTGNSLQWWYDNCDQSVAAEINKNIIIELSKP